MIGQSRLTPEIFRNVSVTAFVSPDCSSEIFTRTLDGALDEILLNVYEFSSPAIANALVAAQDRGVNVTVLVEGGPVGGISPEEKAVIRVMSDKGIPVSAMLPAKGDHAPYRYDHAKYVVVDKRRVLITSENFKYSGFPPQGVSANRGWGVVLEDTGISRYFSTVFSTDMGSPSVVTYTGSPGSYEPAPTRSYTAEFSTESFNGATVSPVIAPDTSYQITDLMNSAQQSIEIEQAYITNETEYELNPYLSAAINASRRGVAVRVLLDSYYYNVEDEKDNDEMAALINMIGKTEQIPLEARCADLPANNIEKIHNKGAIVDDRAVLVSSINWNSNSPNFNREAGVIVEHPGVARYFKTVFEDDWNSAQSGQGIQTDWIRIAVVGLVILLLVLLYYYRHVR
jgi:phosphatidylserine/phosphatidylglycerophosphate/cardiolipin synthase-like enzyme